MFVSAHRRRWAVAAPAAATAAGLMLSSTACESHGPAAPPPVTSGDPSAEHSAPDDPQRSEPPVVDADLAMPVDVVCRSYDNVDGTDPRVDHTVGAVRRRLEQVIDRQLTSWTRPDGTALHAPFCRTSAGSCDERIAAFAEMLTDAAVEYGVDPFLLTAVAVRESGLDPGAVGPAGSVGILQLNPEGIGKDLRIVREPAHRRWCVRHRVDGCQQEVVERGARHLAAWVRKCGDLPSALGGYNSGHCRRTPYARRVLHTYEHLCRESGEIAEKLQVLSASASNDTPAN